ncbi:RagB/SusD family nutrient uptake outer membrane protein [Chitinophaga japonensis]|uniref:Putative outer membrane starch-binding protein n=1 Tax=Chitinophaga japonensis TaxID=104662 RepID=A0A562SZC9_CHIJA|nr:RagB/SusD family nutrient uptake outer membrane protein [Chitinophaga japonensis]TWI86612.1 putative outer membrane starch-binding protein [Chitinophaga japonensis]
MQPKKYISLLCSAALLLMGACNVLDVEPKGNYTTGNYWRNQSDALDGITGIYNVLLEEEYTGFREFVFDNCSDDQVRGGDHGYDQAIEDFTYDPSTPSVRTGWRWKYEQISRANNALIYIPDITDIDPAIKDRCLGEAHFLRAFAYWRLMVLYGEVPIITEEDVLNDNYNKPKVNIDTLRQYIEADLLQAANLLPETYEAGDKGRVSKGSAWGLLCKLYMYWEKLDNAIEYGSMVVNNANYALAPNYVDNFNAATGNNSEVLFAVQSENGWGYTDFVTYHAPRAWGGWSFFYPTKGLVDEFEPGDPRKEVSIMQAGDQVDIGTEIVTYDPSLSGTGYHYRKFCRWLKSGGLDYSMKTPLLRAADVYLLVAEAKIRTLGPGAGDAEINAVRRRASTALPAVSGAGMTELMHERRVELSGENQRHQDLMRWDKAQLIDITTYYNKPKLTYNGTQEPIGGAPRTFVRPKHYYFPLPQQEIDRSKGVLIQNPNYVN